MSSSLQSGAVTEDAADIQYCLLLEWLAAHILQRCLLVGCLIYLERIRQRYLKCCFQSRTVENMQISIQLAKSVDSKYAKYTGQTWQIGSVKDLSQS